MPAKFKFKNKGEHAPKTEYDNNSNASTISQSRLSKFSTAKVVEVAEILKKQSKMNLPTLSGDVNVIPAPFVRNGPPDQSAFHHRLLELQANGLQSDSSSTNRYSLVEEVEGHGLPAQHILECPKSTAVTWNSNYGPHGWHRYVGRFPPHMIRVLLNAFGAGSTSLVCDPFVGSGTTAVECRLLGIPFVGIEICPLSAMMTRVKSCFPCDHTVLENCTNDYTRFFNERWSSFLAGRDVEKISNKEIFARKGNDILEFSNHEKWYSPAALLGTSISVEYAMTLTGYEREAVFIALSSKMRSIGNVDVDVVRAEYRKEPRKNVDVKTLVEKQLRKMAKDIKLTVRSHNELIGKIKNMEVVESSVLDVNLDPGSVDFVITSPPYGIEAISYLRTHLLSYRSLASYLGQNPYDSREKTIGSEYLEDVQKNAGMKSIKISPTMRQYFEASNSIRDRKYNMRRQSMLQFCDDMLTVACKLGRWTKIGGKIAFVIGNKRLGDKIIPMDQIIKEIFKEQGLIEIDSIKHKLKTNNSNSQVPWQKRIIQDEHVIIFERV